MRHDEGYYTVIDANTNRVSEGLRVIEEYTRFITRNQEQTLRISKMRKYLNRLEERDASHHLRIRDIERDTRARETPTSRKNVSELLRANFKRVTEGLRVLEEYTGKKSYNSLRYEVYILEKNIILSGQKPEIKKGVYLISDAVFVLKQGLEWGVSLIQLRDKSSHKADILKKARELCSLAKTYRVPFIVNDYLDIALLTDADGFHSGQDDISLTDLRKIVGPHKILGRTTHSLSQGKKAQKEGADYVSVGPLWETPSKLNRPAIGFTYLKQASSLTLPYVAIGGINAERMREITPYQPPLIGIVRHYEDIPIILKTFYKEDIHDSKS